MREAQVYRIDPGPERPLIHVRIHRQGVWAIYDHVEDDAPIGSRQFLFYASAPCFELLTRRNIMLVGVDPFDDEDDGWRAPTILPNSYTLSQFETEKVNTLPAPSSTSWHVMERSARRPSNQKECHGLDMYGVAASLESVIERFAKHYGLGTKAKLPPQITADAFLRSELATMTRSEFWHIVALAAKGNGDALCDHLIRGGAGYLRSFNAHLALLMEQLALGDLRMLQRHIKPYDPVDEYSRFEHWVILQGEDAVRSVLRGDLSPLVKTLVRAKAKSLDTELWRGEVLDSAVVSAQTELQVYGLEFYPRLWPLKKGRISAKGSLLDDYPELRTFYVR